MDKYDWEEEFRRLQEGESNRVRETARLMYFTKKQGEYTIEDREAFPEDFRCELIDGVIYNLSAPSNKHELLADALYDSLKFYVKQKQGKCKVSRGIFDIQLFFNDEKTILQPDLLIVCDASKFSGTRVVGAPDLVVEILSPSTREKDCGIKLQKYMQAGIRECWLIDLEKKRGCVYAQSAEESTESVLPMPATYTFDDMIPVSIFDGECKIDMTEVYGEIAFLDQM